MYNTRIMPMGVDVADMSQEHVDVSDIPPHNDAGAVASCFADSQKAPQQPYAIRGFIPRGINQLAAFHGDTLFGAPL